MEDGYGPHCSKPDDEAYGGTLQNPRWPASSLRALPAGIHDFSSFMMFFNDMFLQDEYYSNFNMTNDLPMSSVIGEGAQFWARRVSLQGGMAVRTSSDHHTRLTNGDNIVLKKPRLKRAFTDSSALHSIVTELRVLSHPPLRTNKRILDVYGFAWEMDQNFGVGQVSPVLMVEYANYGTLQSYLGDAETLPLEQKLKIASDVAEGLDALHKSHIIHSDLKPENILVCGLPDGNISIKLADFGLSIILNEANKHEVWRNGTPGWMAPEWRTRVPLENLYLTDFYSCGLLLWAVLLDGAQPWDQEMFGKTSAQRLARFEETQKHGDEILDTACSQIKERYNGDQVSIILPLLQSTIRHEPTLRSIDSLLDRALDNTPVESNTSEVGIWKDEETVGDSRGRREIFSDFSELLALPPAVQSQLLSALVGISENEDEPHWRRAEACYALFIFHVERIGTVRPIDSKNLGLGFYGYDLEPEEAVKWLRAACCLGNPRAQAYYYRTSRALGVAIPPAELPTTVKWLESAALEGSYIALQDLKQLHGDGWNLREQVSGSLGSNASQRRNVKDPGDSALHCTAVAGSLDCVSRLLEADSGQKDVNLRNKYNETALFQACRCGHAEVAKLLLSAGADASIATKTGENALHWLCSFGNGEEMLEMAQLLAAAGASVHQSCSGGKGSSTFDNEFLYGTPLRRATGLDNLACVKALLKLGADPYNGGDEYKPPIAEACLGHYDKILEQFLPPHFDVRHPGWYRQPLLRKRDILESVTAIVMRPKSMALGAPRAWANMERQGDAKSLLGYAVNPNLLHERMAHCGPGWKASMRRTIDLILDKGEEDHMRVTPWNTSSILEAVGSGDVDIVSYILDKCADTVTPLLSYPRPNGYSLWLPIHGAIAQRNRRVFDRLLQVAGPETPLGPPQRTGLKNWFLAKRFELFGEKIGTCPPGQQFATVLHMCANTTVDPYFAEALLAKLSREEAETMVMTPGHFGEMPLTCALCNQSFGLAELLLARGASLEDGGRPGPTLAAMVAGIGTSWSEYWALSQANASLQGGQSLLAWVLRLNNEPSTAAVKWLLEHGANFMVDEALGLSALHVAVLAGQRFNLEPGSNRRIFFYGCNLANLHVLLKRFTSKDQLDLTDRLLGLTALQMAVLQLDVKAVQMLKQAGASLETESTEGLTALQLMQRAAEESAPAQLEYLRRIEDLEMLLNLEH